jgi:hypothetical protein
MIQLKYIGGARIGIVHATWPFASLTITKEKIELNATILGKFTFLSDDIISIEPYSEFFSRGLKIIHKVPKYNKKIIFWTFQNPGTIIDEIENIGFYDIDKPSMGEYEKDQITVKQKQGGFPLKIPFTIAIIVIWNILIFSDFLNMNPDKIPFGNGAIMALGFVLITSILLLISKDIRKLALKEGRELNDISKFLYFIIFISLFMLTIILVIPK